MKRAAAPPVLAVLALAATAGAVRGGGGAPAGVATVTVAADGTGQFKSVQAAIDSLPANRAAPTVIRIRPGIYREMIRLGPTHPHVTLRGDGPGAADRTVLTFDRSARTPGPDGKPVGTSNSASVTLDADDVTAEDVTFENSAGPGTKVGQAVAVKVMGDRCVFTRCRFLGWQDTLYASTSSAPAAPARAAGASPPKPAAAGGKAPVGAMPGADRLCRQYYRDCYIAGSVDFIFGSARAVFENCELRSRAPGAVTAHARTAPTQPGGYVFHDCRLTADAGVPAGSVSLGRPWRPYARVVYIDCRMGPHVDPKGWGDWGDPEREKTAFYAEAGDTGPGADRSERVPWEHVLTPAEAAEFDARRFLAGADGWDPAAARPAEGAASSAVPVPTTRRGSRGPAGRA